MTPFDKDAWLKAKQEKVQEMLDSIKDMAKSFKENPETNAELLWFSSRFYKYSARNTMLIYKQNRYATYVQSYDAWKRAGYNVKRGAKGLKVFVPVTVTYLKSGDEYIQLSRADKKLQALYKEGKLESIQKTRFTLGNVFDISQTNCPKEHYPELYQMGYPSEQHAKLCRALEKYAQEQLKVSVSIQNIDSISLGGYYDDKNKFIGISDKSEDTKRLYVIAHEVGHATLHDSLQLPKSQKEFEADAFSILFHAHLGLEVTEDARRHLAQAYRGIDPEKNSIEKILDTVYGYFKKSIKELQPYIDQELGIIRNPERSQDKDQDQGREKGQAKGRSKGNTNSTPEKTKELEKKPNEKQPGEKKPKIRPSKTLIIEIEP